MSDGPCGHRVVVVGEGSEGGSPPDAGTWWTMTMVYDREEVSATICDER